jgi:hypothetical protein
MAVNNPVMNALRSLLNSQPSEPAGVVERMRPVTDMQLEEAELAEHINALESGRPEEFRALIDDATGRYVDLGRFIQAMNPYGAQVVLLPDLKFDDSSDRTDLLALKRDRNIEVAGWLRANDVSNPKASSDSEMTLRVKQECFYWHFRFPDVADTSELENALADGGNADVVTGITARGEEAKGGQMMNLQITKAIRIPFIYRQYQEGRNGRLLRGHLVIGFEGAGGM